MKVKIEKIVKFNSKYQQKKSFQLKKIVICSHFCSFQALSDGIKTISTWKNSVSLKPSENIFTLQSSLLRPHFFFFPPLFILRSLLSHSSLSCTNLPSCELPKHRIWGNVRCYPLTALCNSWAYVGNNPLTGERPCFSGKQNTVCLLHPWLLIM